MRLFRYLLLAEIFWWFLLWRRMGVTDALYSASYLLILSGLTLLAPTRWFETLMERITVWLSLPIFLVSVVYLLRHFEAYAQANVLWGGNVVVLSVCSLGLIASLARWRQRRKTVLSKWRKEINAEQMDHSFSTNGTPVGHRAGSGELQE